MKLKKFNNRALRLITCFCILYLINLPEVVKYSDAEILFKTNILIILDIFVVSCLSTFVPCIHYINKGEKLDYETGRRVVFCNSLIVFAVGMISSIFLVKTYGYYFLVSTFLGSILFYFINLNLFVDYKCECKFFYNFICYIIVIATFLTILCIGINFVRSSIDPPSYRIEELTYYPESK